MLEDKENFLDSIKSITKKIKKAQSHALVWKKKQSYQNFVETIIELFEKKEKLKKAEVELLNHKVEDEDILSHQEAPTHCSKLQHCLINRSRDFHQEVYNSTSCLIAFTNISIKEKYRDKMPINSIEKFYKYLLDKHPSISKEIDILIKSRDFRSYKVVHTPLKPPYNWFSMENRIIYYLPSKEMTEEAKIQYENIFKEIYPKYPSEPLSSPLMAQEFFIAPETEETINSFMKMSKKFLKTFTDKNLKN